MVVGMGLRDSRHFQMDDAERLGAQVDGYRVAWGVAERPGRRVADARDSDKAAVSTRAELTPAPDDARARCPAGRGRLQPLDEAGTSRPARTSPARPVRQRRHQRRRVSRGQTQARVRPPRPVGPTRISSYLAVDPIAPWLPLVEIATWPRSQSGHACSGLGLWGADASRRGPARPTLAGCAPLLPSCAHGRACRPDASSVSARSCCP